MEDPPDAAMHSIGIVIDSSGCWVQPGSASKLLFSDDLSRTVHQWVLCGVPRIGDQVSKMRLSLARDSTSKAARHLVPVNDAAAQVSCLWIPQPWTYERFGQT